MQQPETTRDGLPHGRRLELLEGYTSKAFVGLTIIFKAPPRPIPARVEEIGENVSRSPVAKTCGADGVRTIVFPGGQDGCHHLRRDLVLADETLHGAALRLPPQIFVSPLPTETSTDGARLLSPRHAPAIAPSIVGVRVTAKGAELHG